MSSSRRFSKLLDNIALTVSQQTDGEKKHRGVRNCLNRHYYSLDSDYANSRLVGSWGKSTEVRPPRDIDVLFVLPNSVYGQISRRTGNQSSQLLQEVKGVIQGTYPFTEVKGDGPVVVIQFDSFCVELVPAFQPYQGSYSIPITTGMGKLKSFAPEAEIQHLQKSDSATGGKTRHLIRMAKVWQRVCNVDIKSFWLELLAVDFLTLKSYRYNDISRYGYMVRDYFEYIKFRTSSTVVVPGTNELLSLAMKNWGSKAESAHTRSIKACDYEDRNRMSLAGEEWQKIFGSDVPIMV